MSLFGRLRASGIAAAALAVVASWLVLSWPWLGGEAVIPWDSKDQFYPALGFVADSIRSGEQPFWNPFIYGGYPMVSDPQSMMFSPLALFLMLLAETPSVRWFDAIELLHLLMGGLGLLWFSMRQGLSPLAGVFPAVVYMFGGAAAARLQHVPMICAYGYVPLALLALDTALETGRLRHAAAFGLVGGVMAAHQNQVAYLFCLVLLAYALWRILSSGRPARFLSDRWRALAVACTCGALTLAAPLYATLQFLPLTRRIDLPPEVSGENALHPLSWLTFLVGEFFGNSDPSVYWGLGDLTETYLYTGTLPIVLILIVGFGGGALSEGRARFWLGVGLLACLYALGNLTPFYGFLYELLPGVSFYRRPADAAFVLNLVLAVLTGFLIERLRHGPLARRGSLALLAALAFLAGLLSMGLLEALREARFGGLPEALAAAAAWFLPAVLLVAVLARPLSSILRRRLVLASFLFLLFDIGFNNINQYFNSADPVDFGALDPGIGSPRPLAALERELGIDPGGGAYRVEVVQAGSLYANLPMLFGLQSTQGYNPLRYGLYERGAGAQETHSSPRPFPPMLPGYGAPMLDLLGVRFVASARDLGEIDPGADEFLVPGPEIGGWDVRENPDPVPRVVAATRAVLEPDPDGAIREGRLARVDYRTTVVLDRLPEGLDPGADSGEVSARIVSYRNGRVAVEVDGGRESVLVLHDLYYPGWEVAIDGERAEMLRANYLFRGVWVPAGRHTVTFRFRPFAPGGVAGTVRRYFDARREARRPRPSDGFPELGSLEPSRGSGWRQTFRFRFRDPDGFGDLTRQTILFNDTLSVAAGCYLYHEAGRVQLSDDSGVNWQGPVTLGEPGVLENSQCRIEAGPSSSSGAGDELTLSVDMTFFGAFEGIHSVWAYTEDSGGRSAFGRVGYWALRTDPTFLDRLRLQLGLPGR